MAKHAHQHSGSLVSGAQVGAVQVVRRVAHFAQRQQLCHRLVKEQRPERAVVCEACMTGPHGSERTRAKATAPCKQAHVPLCLVGAALATHGITSRAKQSKRHRHGQAAMHIVITLALLPQYRRVYLGRGKISLCAVHCGA